MYLKRSPGTCHRKPSCHNCMVKIDLHSHLLSLIQMFRDQVFQLSDKVYNKIQRRLASEITIFLLPYTHLHCEPSGLIKQK